MLTSDFASELNTNIGAYEILHLLTKNDHFSVYEQEGINVMLMTILLPNSRNLP
jgi:hypothetical protein